MKGEGMYVLYYSSSALLLIYRIAGFGYIQYSNMAVALLYYLSFRCRLLFSY